MESKGQPTQAAGLLDDLVKNREKIKDAIPWEDLEDKERIERLRSYVKMVQKEMAVQYTTEINSLKKRINALERHTHNDKGEPVVVEKFTNKYEGMMPQVEYNGNHPVPSTLDLDNKGSSGGYI